MTAARTSGQVSRSLGELDTLRESVLRRGILDKGHNLPAKTAICLPEALLPKMNLDKRVREKKASTPSSGPGVRHGLEYNTPLKASKQDGEGVQYSNRKKKLSS